MEEQELKELEKRSIESWEQREKEGLATWLGDLTKAVDRLSEALEFQNTLTCKINGLYRLGG